MSSAQLVERRVALVALVALTVACGRSDPPRLKVTALPESRQSGGIEARFQLRNIGGRELVFDGLTTSCGCAAVSRLPEALAPGMSTQLAVRCRSGGETPRELRLRSSDPGNPDTTLRLPEPGAVASADPAALYFGYVPVGGSSVQDVALSATAALAGPPPAHPEISIESQVARGDGTRIVRIRFTPRVPGVVRATLDLGARGGVLPVVAVGYDDLLAYPAEIAPPRTIGSAALPVVTLIGIGDQPLALGRIEYPPGIAGELRTVVPGRQFQLLLRGGLSVTGPAVIRLHGAARGDLLLSIAVLGPEGVGAAS